MSDQQHPITPPPELIQVWTKTYRDKGYDSELVYDVLERRIYAHDPGQSQADVFIQAANWGADKELEACCEYLRNRAAWEPGDIAELRAARRPKPLTLQEQTLQAVSPMDDLRQASADVSGVEVLSPATQVVLDAFRTSHTGRGCLAAALRAATNYCPRERRILMTIADELEQVNDD